MDIAAARERLLEQERHRPSYNDFSAFWEHGDWWRQAFDDLAAAELARDALYTQHLVAAVPGSDTARERLRAWAGQLRDSAEWYERQLLSTLRLHLRACDADEDGRPLAPPELIEHLALADARRADCLAHTAALAVEYLEHSRRLLWALDAADWDRGWQLLLAAFREQQEVALRWHGAADLPTDTYAARLSWCERIHALQLDTNNLWVRHSQADLAELRRATSIVAAYLETLRPRPAAPGGALIGFLAAGVLALLFIIAVSSSPGAASQAGVATATAQGMPTALASPVQADAPADPAALNEQGKALLAQGRTADALAQFQQAAAANPSWHEPLSNAAFCLYDLGRRDEAIAQWRAALALNPDSQDAHAGLGMALYQDGQREPGLAEYRRAIELGGDYRSEEWMRAERLWSENAIADSRPLRAAPTPSQ